METHPVSFIVVHIISALDWNRLAYRRKKNFHYLISSMGKKIPLKSLQPPIACIDVAFVGDHRSARDSGSLYTLLQDLWGVYPDAEVVYADELQERNGPSVRGIITRSLIQLLPGRVQRMLPGWKSLLTLHTLLPLI